MKYESFVKDSYGFYLQVLQEIPSKGDKFPTVILVPGFGMDLHEYGYFDQISDVLIKNGFATIRFSFEGLGKSQGKFLDMTIDKQAQQLKDVINFVEKDRFTHKERMGILAHSFGTATTMVALPLENIKTILFTGTATDPNDSLTRSFRRQRGYNPEGISSRERADNRITKIGSQFWGNIAQHIMKKDIVKINQPILFIHGEKDINAKAPQVQELFDLVKGKKRFLLIDKADHAFTGEFRPKVLELIASWFEETLR